jgi:hypothetical protein
MPDGQTHAEKMTVQIPAIAKAFSAKGILAPIRAAPADSIRCPEFVKQAAAGIIA